MVPTFDEQDPKFESQNDYYGTFWHIFFNVIHYTSKRGDSATVHLICDITEKKFEIKEKLKLTEQTICTMDNAMVNLKCAP